MLNPDAEIKVEKDLRISGQGVEGTGKKFPSQHLPLGDGHARIPRVAELGVNPVKKVSVNPSWVPRIETIKRICR